MPTWGCCCNSRFVCGSETIADLISAQERQGRRRLREKSHMNQPLTPGSSSSSLAPGTRFGAYEIIHRLGAGGMGEVYRAKDTRLGREVAIKTISLGRGSHSDSVQRFEQEARSASSLNHPNIVTIYELGQVNGTHYI